MPPPMIAGLYSYTRNGVTRRPEVTLSEIPISLATNPTYRDDLLVLEGDDPSAARLESFGLRAHRVFNDTPAAVRVDAAHKMKHWMCRWALKEFGEFLWVDWDTVLLRRPDQSFWAWCRRHGTPRFIHIPGYWATVNCGVTLAQPKERAALADDVDLGSGRERRQLLGERPQDCDPLFGDRVVRDGLGAGVEVMPYGHSVGSWLSTTLATHVRIGVARSRGSSLAIASRVEPIQWSCSSVAIQR